MFVNESANSFGRNNFHVFVEYFGVDDQNVQFGEPETWKPMSGQNFLLDFGPRFLVAFHNTLATPKALVLFWAMNRQNWIFLEYFAYLNFDLINETSVSNSTILFVSQ